ncbi:MAG: hypothetical protein H6745_23245 [Deltaproteobacteria bacterium]|nr:hypothetical protein [Deltaproteobacteria bacterium]
MVGARPRASSSPAAAPPRPEAAPEPVVLAQEDEATSPAVGLEAPVATGSELLEPEAVPKEPERPAPRATLGGTF